jgi:glycosyltransferase involved in cell wall biosynthesis
VARILFLSHYALPHLGGIEVVIDELARQFVRAGHVVVHVASASERAHEGNSGHGPTSYERICIPSLNVLEVGAGVPWPVFGPQLIPVLRREVARADVVHGHGLLYLSSVLGLLAAKRTQAVRVLTEHVGHVHYDSKILDRVEGAAMRTVGRLAARAAEGIVVLNDKVWKEMAALAPEAKLVRIPNGVDVERYRLPDPGERERLRKALGWDERPRVLFVGRLVRKKGIELVLSVAARLAGRACFVVVGPGHIEPASNVQVLGTLAPSRVAELYRAADVFLLPSQGEGFPLVVQEAMASGLPVVLADDPSYAPYLVKDGVRTSAPETQALIQTLEPLLDSEVRQFSGAAAAGKAQADFSWSVAAQAHLRLYAELRAARR